LGKEGQTSFEDVKETEPSGMGGFEDQDGLWVG
jgi:hypothetical protein